MALSSACEPDSSSPKSLEEVYADSNKISCISHLPKSLRIANFMSNQLESKPEHQNYYLLLKYSLNYHAQNITQYEHIYKICNNIFYDLYMCIKIIINNLDVFLLVLCLPFLILVDITNSEIRKRHCLRIIRN